MICEAHDILTDQIRDLAGQVAEIRRMIVRSAIATVSALTAVITVYGWVI